MDIRYSAEEIAFRTANLIFLEVDDEDDGWRLAALPRVSK